MENKGVESLIFHLYEKDFSLILDNFLTDL